jgi:hypothetical protein
MRSNFIATFHSIRQLSPDGLLKRPRKLDRGFECDVFDEAYSTRQEAERAILEKGDEFTHYVVLTMTRIESA